VVDVDPAAVGVSTVGVVQLTRTSTATSRIERIQKR